MGDYITKKSDMKFQSQEALKSVQSVIDDADAALHDKSTGSWKEIYINRDNSC